MTFEDEFPSQIENTDGYVMCEDLHNHFLDKQKVKEAFNKMINDIFYVTRGVHLPKFNSDCLAYQEAIHCFKEDLGLK